MLLIVVNNHMTTNHHRALKNKINELHAHREHLDRAQGRTPTDPLVDPQIDTIEMANQGAVENTNDHHIKRRHRHSREADRHQQMKKIQRPQARHLSLGQDQQVAHGQDPKRHLVPLGHHTALLVVPPLVGDRPVLVLNQVPRAHTLEVDHALGHHQDLGVDHPIDVVGAAVAEVVVEVVVAVAVEASDPIIVRAHQEVEEASGQPVLTEGDLEVVATLDEDISKEAAEAEGTYEGNVHRGHVDAERLHFHLVVVGEVRHQCLHVGDAVL